jgi:hypothetical protein
MSDFSTEELYDTVDRAVVKLLEAGRVVQPPIPAVRLIQELFHYTIREEEEEDDSPKQYGDRPKPRPRPREIVFKSTQSETAKQSLAARAIAKEMVPDILKTLGVVVGTEQKSATNQLVGLIAPRLVLPTKWFTLAARRANNDLLKLREAFEPTAYEWIAVRLLELEDPCVIAIVDDGSVSSRKSNFAQLNKKLTEAEERCAAKVQESEEPQTVRWDGWTSRGWPTPSGPFNRIILRSTPDDV